MRLIALSKSELTQVCDAIDQGAPYHWPIGTVSSARLAEITTAVGNTASRDALSRVLGPMLDSDERQVVARWIIRDWGGIRRVTDENIAAIVVSLGAYSDASVNKFVAQNKCVRISSWSKLLAFRNGQKWAIYDSRTAVALNVALIAIGHPPPFEMPLSRNTKIEPRRKAIAARQHPKSVSGYHEYLEILKALRAHLNLPAIGDVEMILFANAERICSNLRLSFMPAVAVQAHRF